MQRYRAQTIHMGRHLLQVIACLLLLPCICIAQAVKADSTATATQAANPASETNPDSIYTFEKLEMPVEMAMQISRMSPKEALLYHDEFQQMHDGLYGQSIRTIKVWYIDDRIIGYILERPFDAGPGPRLRKQKINIPILWVCTPAIQGHEEHTATTLESVRTTTAASKCTGWHLQLPDEYGTNPRPMQKLKAGKKEVPKVGDFGHSEKTDHKKDRKKKGKGFDQYNEEQPATDSTQAKPVKDSL